MCTVVDTADFPPSLNGYPPSAIFFSALNLSLKEKSLKCQNNRNYRHKGSIGKGLMFILLRKCATFSTKNNCLQFSFPI